MKIVITKDKTDKVNYIVKSDKMVSVSEVIRVLSMTIADVAHKNAQAPYFNKNTTNENKNG